MATTIKLKTGSGAPAASALAQGEPAFDLTNKRLYTENASGEVIEVGTNPTTLSLGGTAITSTAAEINILDGVTATKDELNILDGVTATATELNLLDGVTATTAELNYVDGVTANIQTQIDALATSASPTFTGTSTFVNLDISGDIDVDGTTNLDAVDIDGAVDMASTLAVNGVTTITTGNNSAQLILKSTDFDTNVGPRLDMVRDKANSTDIADNDMLGQIRFLGDDSTNTQISYAFIRGKAVTVADGSETGQLDFTTKVSGSDKSRIKISDTVTSVNEDGQNIDFRVEGDSSTHLFFCDASTNRIGIKTNSPATELDVDGGITATTLNLGNWQIKVDSNELVFVYNSTEVFKVGTNGAVTSANDITAFGTI